MTPAQFTAAGLLAEDMSRCWATISIRLKQAGKGQITPQQSAKDHAEQLTRFCTLMKQLDDVLDGKS